MARGLTAGDASLLARVEREGGVLVARVEPERNMRRWYRLRLQDDLLGGTDLVREWGRLGPGPRPRSLVEPHPDLGAAKLALLAAIGRRLRRGYRPLDAP